MAMKSFLLVVLFQFSNIPVIVIVLLLHLFLVLFKDLFAI